jgi:predicted ABC-type ATPase
MFVVAGPPGSGKTTYFPVSAFGVDSFNIDDRCAQLLGSYRAIPRNVRTAVAHECERFVRAHIVGRTSFAVETTLRTNAAVMQAIDARAEGFATDLRFIATESVEENIVRVMQRARSGGHAASEGEIRAIYTASIANLREVLRVFERVSVYDSSREWEAPSLVATAHRGVVVLGRATPAWLERALEGST